MVTVAPELKAFLEEAPPYTERKLNGALERHMSGSVVKTPVYCLVRPEIELYCQRDGRRQTFRWHGHQVWISEGLEPANIDYRCKNCDQERKVFALLLAKPSVFSRDRRPFPDIPQRARHRWLGHSKRRNN
jgi:hypothetical protein